MTPESNVYLAHRVTLFTPLHCSSARGKEAMPNQRMHQ